MIVVLHLSQDEAADALLTKDPLALLIGMVLDQQVPLEWAFSAPLLLQQRLAGRLHVTEIAAMDPEALAGAFSTRPALHRFPASNAKRVQELSRQIVDEYQGKPDSIWRTASSGQELFRRIRALPGFGDQKARIFIGLLGKQLGVRPPGWQEAAGTYGQPGTFMSVADITDPSSLARVRAFKQERKAASKSQAG